MSSLRDVEMFASISTNMSSQRDVKMFASISNNMLSLRDILFFGFSLPICRPNGTLKCLLQSLPICRPNGTLKCLLQSLPICCPYGTFYFLDFLYRYVVPTGRYNFEFILFLLSTFHISHFTFNISPAKGGQVFHFTKSFLSNQQLCNYNPIHYHTSRQL